MRRSLPLSDLAQGYNDSAAHSLAAAADIPFDAARGMLAKVRRRSTGEILLGAWLARGPTVNGHVFVAMSFPAAKGQRRMSVRTFLSVYRRGRYILVMNKRVVAVVNGRIHGPEAHDSQVDLDRCVFAAHMAVRPASPSVPDGGLMLNRRRLVSSG